MTIPQYYESNRKKDLSYIAPKKNKHDTRIVSGTTREKDSTLLSSMLNLNAEATIAAFDEEDMLINELGESLGDMCHKSREIEDYAKKRPLLYREMIAQGDVYVEELFIEKFENVPLEKLDWDPTKDGVSKFSFSERLKKVYGECHVRMVPGVHVYEGDMRIEYIEDQPVVVTVRVRNRNEMEKIYGQWERWKHVPYTVDSMEHIEEAQMGTYKDWNMVQVNNDQVAEIRVYDPIKNRMMILLNGVMMLPTNFPLTAISPSGEVPMAQGKLEPITNFSRSKSQPSKTKVEQAVVDEITSLMVEKTRQSFKPPMGNATGKVYGQDIFVAGRITNEIKRNQLFPLLPDGSRGINAAEFNFYQLIKDSISEKTVNDVYAGNDPQGDPTATEVLAQKEQQALKLGMALDGLTNFERRMYWLRIYNILENWTKEVDTKVNETKDAIVSKFRSFSVEATIETGEKGMKVFRMQTDEAPDRFAQVDEEEQMSKDYGKPVRIIYMNPEKLRMLKAYFFIIINPTPKSNDKLSQLLFVQNITQAINMFGLESLNIEYVKQRFAILIGEDYNKFFKDMSLEQMMQMQLQQQEGGGQPGGRKTEKPMTPAVTV